jgi:hypothetical protein
MELIGNNFYEKNESFFHCSKCDFKCSFDSDWKRHLSTRKHAFSKDGTKMEINGTKFGEKNEKNEKKEFVSCENCNKKYKTMSGLWKHKNKGECTKNNNEEMKYTENFKNNIVVDKNNEISQETILSILKQNNELQQMLMEQNKTIIELSKNNTITNCNNNSNNKTFNLQFFLNETCKDAMNIMDFVDSIKLQLSDLENVGEIGYVEGISNIIVKNLKELDITERPVHCTDKKRETIYIKDEDKWEKDNDNKKMHKVIKKVADKNARLLPEFKKVHPEYNKSSSKYSDQYNKIIIESMGGAGDDDYEKEEKIIKKITKEVVVSK